MNFIFKELLPITMVIISSYFLGIVSGSGFIIFLGFIVFIFAYRVGRRIELNNSKINYYKKYIYILFAVIILMIIHLAYLRYYSGERIDKNRLVEDIINTFQSSRVEYKNNLHYVIASYTLSLLYQLIPLIGFFLGIRENKNKVYSKLDNFIFLITILFFLFIELYIIISFFLLL